MKIGFHTNSLTLRGTEIALYDYAVHNQTMLGNESVVFYRQRNPANQSVLDKFTKQFNVLTYDGQDQLNRLIEQHGIDLAYFIKSGERDDAICSSAPSLIHAVFPTHPGEFHGDKYAFVSEWLSKEYSNKKIPFVPHMIQLPDHTDDLRSHLAIPGSATVIGSYGGADSFNLTFAQEAIIQALQKRSDLYFLFMNITPFAEHERLLFLPGNSDLDFKVKFINTCDSMIHARGIGESFGLSCGEFSIKGKPIITYALSPQRSHIEILGNKAILYKNKRDLERIFFDFDRGIQHQQNWDAYSTHFSPAPIMEQFKAVFIDGEGRAKVQLRAQDYLAIQGYRLQRKLRHLSRKIYL
jgi:hypothetical protein